MKERKGKGRKKGQNDGEKEGRNQRKGREKAIGTKEKRMEGMRESGRN